MQIPDQPLAAYWYALGKFVHRYSEIEFTLHQILRIVADCSEGDAKVLFSGTRVRDAKDFIKRFHAARRRALPDELGRAFERLELLTSTRDRLLHHGISFEKGAAIVTDETKNVAARAFKHAVSIGDLDDLEADAITLNACLTAYWIKERRPDLLDSPDHKGWIELAGTAWRYKQPKPMRPRSMIRGGAREHKRQVRTPST